MKLDGGWLKILEQKTWVFIVLCAFSVVLFYFVREGYAPTLSAFKWLGDLALLFSVLFGFLAIGYLSPSVIDIVKLNIFYRKQKKLAVSRLYSLSEIEHSILSYLIQMNQKSFNSRLDNGDVHLLVQKGLIIRENGQQNIMKIAHFVPDFVWIELKRRKAFFNSADLQHNPPWVRHWMTY